MIKIAALVLSLGGPAHAEIWDEFASRCIAPVENVAMPDTEGLERINMGAPDADGIFDAPDHAFQLFIFREDGSGPMACSITGFGESANARVDTQFQGWMQDQLSNGRYVSLPDQPGAAVLLESTQWREPKIRVLVEPFQRSGAKQLMILETDLES